MPSLVGPWYNKQTEPKDRSKPLQTRAWKGQHRQYGTSRALDLCRTKLVQFRVHGDGRGFVTFRRSSRKSDQTAELRKAGPSDVRDFFSFSAHISLLVSHFIQIAKPFIGIIHGCGCGGSEEARKTEPNPILLILLLHR